MDADAHAAFDALYAAHRQTLHATCSVAAAMPTWRWICSRRSLSAPGATWPCCVTCQSSGSAPRTVAESSCPEHLVGHGPGRQFGQKFGRQGVLGSRRSRPNFGLVAVGRNLVIDHARAAATRRSTSEALALQSPVDSSVDAADHQLVQRERFSQVDAAIKRLPEDLRIVLVLQAVDERTSGEIGELLGRPAGTVRYQLAEARRRLARDLALDQ